MKTKSIIKKIALGICPIAAAVAPISLVTSCSKNNGIYTRYITFEKAFNEESFSKAKKAKYSATDLLLGSNKFSNGNYILIIGSNSYQINDDSYSKITKFLGGPNAYRIVDNWFSQKFFKTSILANEIEQVNKLKTSLKDKFVNFSFVTYIDDFDFKFYDKSGHEIYITDNAKESTFKPLEAFSPFDKWTNELIVNTRQFNRDNFDYEWNADLDDPEVVEGDYIRQDTKAKEYRKFMSCGARWFPKSDDKRKISFDNEKGAPRLAVYRDGKLKDIVELQTEIIDHKEDDKETTSVYGLVNKYFNTTDEDK